MSDEDDVIAAARARGRALAQTKGTELRDLLHPQFLWSSHTGSVFDRDAYLRANRGGRLTWHSQEVNEPRVAVVGDAAVLRCVVVDRVEIEGRAETFEMPVTQTWVRVEGHWVCLAGHAGPRVG